ncbi:MAG TPA: GDSL-type esterase/lipase family protein [Candidatus Acidoferrales bacterium]|nr:GDSL-type esterase/lipase family protein [Candidatus Acidoferrales bacterium]
MKKPASPLRRRSTLRLLLGLLLFGPFALLANPLPQQPIRVACIGASGTYGYNLKDREHNSYPAWLGRWLGTNYDVRNFGVNGTTLMSSGNSPWVKQPAHAEALAFKPDIVIILFGGNDSKHPGDGSLDSSNAPNNWAHKADFVPDYEAFIAEFRQANPSAKIYVCYPTPCFPGRWGINDRTIHYEILPLIHQIATESHAQIIDLYDAFAGRKDLFQPDTVHPNEAGARLMAADIYSAVSGKTPPP